MKNYQLIEHARQAQQHAKALYSHFKVGAALLSKSGRVYTGCNIESSSYGLTLCAERVALFKALSEGEEQFEALAITSSGEGFCPPCGACRQVLWDFANGLRIILADQKGTEREFALAELLPLAFDGDYLHEK